VELVGVATASSLSAHHVADRYGFTFCTTNEDEILHDVGINLVIIATRHNLHALQSIAALQAGKDVFVEKPLALNRDELAAVLQAQQQTGRRLMVGFNRRFAPMVREMRRFLAHHRRPLLVTCRVNAGPIPRTHWTQDPAIGGGRILGEACHFIDLLQFLTGALPLEVSTTALETPTGVVDDEVVITITFADGSVGTVIYAAGGDKAYSKERIEVLGDGRIATLDDFHTLELVHNGRRRTYRERLRPDKGHRAEWEALSRAILHGSPTPISPLELAATHLATFAAIDSLRERRPIPVDASRFWQTIASD
jgi:predicted dehydrogenase